VIPFLTTILRACIGALCGCNADCRIEPRQGDPVSQFSTSDGIDGTGDFTTLNSNWVVDKGHAAPYGSGPTWLRIYSDVGDGETIVRSVHPLSKSKSKIHIGEWQFFTSKDSLRIYIDPRLAGVGVDNFAVADQWTMLEFYADTTDRGDGYCAPYMELWDVTGSGASSSKIRKKLNLGDAAIYSPNTGGFFGLSLCRGILLCTCNALPSGIVSRPSPKQLSANDYGLYLSGTWGIGGLPQGDYFDIQAEDVSAANTDNLIAFGDPGGPQAVPDCRPDETCYLLLTEVPSEIVVASNYWVSHTPPYTPVQTCDCAVNNVTISCPWTHTCTYYGENTIEPACVAIDNPSETMLCTLVTAEASIDGAADGTLIIGSGSCGIALQGARYGAPMDIAPGLGYWIPSDIIGPGKLPSRREGTYQECAWGGPAADDMYITGINYEPSD
jgi:hypothetical protein